MLLYGTAGALCFPAENWEKTPFLHLKERPVTDPRFINPVLIVLPLWDIPAFNRFPPAPFGLWQQGDCNLQSRELCVPNPDGDGSGGTEFPVAVPHTGGFSSPWCSVGCARMRFLRELRLLGSAWRHKSGHGITAVFQKREVKHPFLIPRDLELKPPEGVWGGSQADLRGLLGQRSFPVSFPA